MPVMKVNVNSQMFSDFNAAYYGGRVEVFQSGINLGKVYHFDVPGLYAGMMKKDLPIGNPVYVDKVTGTDTTAKSMTFLKTLKLSNMCGFFTCDVVTPINMDYPVLPVKYIGKLTFPLGTFTGT